LGIKYLLNHPSDKGRGEAAFKYVQDLSKNLKEEDSKYGKQSIQVWLKIAETMSLEFKNKGVH
jgi:hypothetical protein